MCFQKFASLVLVAGSILTITACKPVRQAEIPASPNGQVQDKAEVKAEVGAEPLAAQTPPSPFNSEDFAEFSTPIVDSAVQQVSTLQVEQSSAGTAVRDCMVEGINDYRISASVDGVLTQLTVEEGNQISSDDLIASIDPQQAELTLALKQAEMEQARLQAENDVNVRAAEKSMEYEWAEAKSAEKLHEKQAMTYWDMRREVLEAERSKLAIELAVNEQKVAEATYSAKRAEHALAQHEIEKRQIKSTFPGIIATRYAKEGEWVQAGTPIVRVVNLKYVKIEGDVDPLKSSVPVRPGTPVQIRIGIGLDQYHTVQGTLNYVSPILESDGTYRVWAKIENKQVGDRWLISPGMPAEMTIISEGTATLN